MTKRTTEPSEPKRPEGAAGAAWGLALYAGTRAIEIFLEAQSMAASVGQALLVEWGASRVGVAWTDPNTTTTAVRIAQRAATGFAVGLAVSGILFGVLAFSGAVLFERVTSIEAPVLALGFFSAALSAWRDELLVHGVTLRVLESSRVGMAFRVLACATTSAGAALGRSDVSPRTVTAAALLGAVFGALWVKDRGAWLPWAAHTGFVFATSTLLSGGIVQSRLADDLWAGGSAGVLGGAAATIALAPLGVLAVTWAMFRGFSPRAPRVG